MSSNISGTILFEERLDFILSALYLLHLICLSFSLFTVYFWQRLVWNSCWDWMCTKINAPNWFIVVASKCRPFSANSEIYILNWTKKENRSKSYMKNMAFTRGRWGKENRFTDEIRQHIAHVDVWTQHTNKSKKK